MTTAHARTGDHPSSLQARSVPLFSFLALAALLSTTPAAQNSGVDWARYLGGPGNDLTGWLHGVHTMPGGDVLVCGGTDGGFPLAPQSAGLTDSVIVRVSADDGTLRWAVTLGGSANDSAQGLNGDPTGQWIYVTGHTDSADFPVTANAARQVHAGATDMFAAILDAQTGALVYATFLGGSDIDYGIDITPDGSGARGRGFWLSGQSQSKDFPVGASAYQSALRGFNDMVLARIDPDTPGAGAISYATYLGGSSRVWNLGDLHVDSAGILTTSAETESADFPTTSTAFQPVAKFTAGSGSSDAVIIRLDPGLPPAQQLVWGTYLGGNGFDNANALHVTAAGLVTVGGFTRSTDLPTTAGAVHSNYRGGIDDGYVAQLDPAQTGSSQLQYLTYLGGSRTDGVNDLVVDQGGMITICGNGNSPDFATTSGAWLPAAPGPGTTAAYVARIDPDAVQGRILYATYVGGTQRDTLGTSIALDPLGGVYAVGRTQAPDLPVTAGPSFGGGWDFWIARLNQLPAGAARCGDSTPSSKGPSYIGVNRQPVAGDPGFSILAGGAPHSSVCPTFGALFFGAPNCGGTQVPQGLTLHLQTSMPMLAVPTNPVDDLVELNLPLASTWGGLGVACQFVWFEPCPGNTFSATNALLVTVQ